MAKGIILGQEPNIDDKLKEINNKFNNYLPLSGGTMNGQINMNNKKITGLSNAVNNTDAVNLQQLNSKISSIPTPNSTTIVSYQGNGGDTITVNLQGYPNFCIIMLPKVDTSYSFGLLCPNLSYGVIIGGTSNMLFQVYRQETNISFGDSYANDLFPINRKERTYQILMIK